MQCNKRLKEFLTGEKFSNGAIFNLSTSTRNVLYRDNYLLQIAKDKKIIHIGFVDHMSLIDDKISNKKWLHDKLINISELCYGIDINKEGVEYIQNKYNYENLFIVCRNVFNN